MSEIKPCPFCGKEQSENNFFSSDGYPEACGCWEKTHTGQEAIDVWNTRPIEDTLCSERDEWKADAERLAKDNERMAQVVGGRDIDEWKNIEQHRALVEKELLKDNGRRLR